jgi:DNA-binding transcriptional regulator YdaS (Cro superfamily)
MARHRFFSEAVAGAIAQAGGVTAVSRALGVGYQSVYEWSVGLRRIPGARAIQLARLIGVQPETLRPDLADYWQSIREAA